MVVYHDKHYNPRHTIAQAYHLAWDYAARRVFSASFPKKSCLLPVRYCSRSCSRGVSCSAPSANGV
jgi:hypothetical protein